MTCSAPLRHRSGTGLVFTSGLTPFAIVCEGCAEAHENMNLVKQAKIWEAGTSIMCWMSWQHPLEIHVKGNPMEIVTELPLGSAGKIE